MMRFLSSLFPLILLTVAARAETVQFKSRCLTDVVAQVPGILASQNVQTGRFGDGIWIVTDQNVMLALAAAWSLPSASNPYYHSLRVLDAIMLAGDALIADADADGRWEFRKKDGSTWGPIYQPWIYSRWVRSYTLVRDAMPADRRARWDRALRLGYAGISRQLRTDKLKNIPAHHAMGLYFAGKLFGEEAWTRQASDFLHRVVGVQSVDGYWSEHSGPVVMYGYVYSEALGVYYSVSRDAAVLPALAKAAAFHAHFTYPDGTMVETIDERNPYRDVMWIPNTGFTMTPEGRSFLARQLARWGSRRLAADEAAQWLLYGEEGEGVASASQTPDADYLLGKGDAAVRRRGPWFLAASALTAPVSEVRWIQDRQNFVSVYHDRVGLLLGGGNTKLQPLWSTFTVGDESLLRHKPGDTNPNFLPPAGLRHVPDGARLLKGGDFGVDLHYGASRGTVKLRVVGPDVLEVVYSGARGMTAHLTALTREGVSIELPPGARLIPLALPHDPYKKDGHAEASQGRVVVEMSMDGREQIVRVRVRSASGL
jgi:hypothetical protein